MVDHLETAGSTAQLSTVSEVKLSFTADKPGTYVVQLIVNDGTLDSHPDTVQITTENVQPAANAGPDQKVAVGSTAQLDGSASSDVNGDTLTFKWSLTSVPTGSSALLSSTTAVKPTFVADKPGLYVAQLLVNDGKLDSLADTVEISTVNGKPTANPGPPQSVFVGETVHLSCAGYHRSGRRSSNVPLELHFGSPGCATPDLTASGKDASFVVPCFGDYVVQLIVNDGKQDSAPASVTISTKNSKPVADAGVDQTVEIGATVQLDGTGSSDADKDTLRFAWSFTAKPEGSSAVISDPSSPRPTFMADQAGTYVVQLIVNDGKEDSVPPDTVTIITSSVEPPGTLHCGSNATGNLGKGQTDTYKFQATAGDSVLVAVSSAGGALVIAELYAPDGKLIGGAPWNGTTGSVKLNATGQYTVLVKSADTTSAAGAYGVSLQFTNGRCGTCLCAARPHPGQSSRLPSTYLTYSRPTRAMRSSWLRPAPEEHSLSPNYTAPMGSSSPGRLERHDRLGYAAHHRKIHGSHKIGGSYIGGW